MTEPEKATQRFVIFRLSLRYQPDQDRVRVDAVDAAGGHCALWITRRMAAVWIAPMAQWLQSSSRLAASAPVALQQEAVAMESAVITARRARTESPPVAPRAQARLVQQIDLNRQGQKWTMVFKCAPEDGHAGAFEALMQSDTATVHHLAQALAKQIELAGWTQPVAMGWLGDQGKPQPAAPGTLLN